MITLVSPTEAFFRSFHQTLDAVAKEEIYIEMTEAKSFEETAAFQQRLIDHNWPVYYAVASDKVVGWVDITPAANPRLAHRGFLGMGILAGFRGKGIGTQLLNKALQHARSIGLEKVELSVYTHNSAALRLYEKLGFTKMGLVKHYRKLNGRYFDCVEMELFLSSKDEKF